MRAAVLRETPLLVLTLVLVRPISGRVSEIDGLMLLTVGVVWVALQVLSDTRSELDQRSMAATLLRAPAESTS